MQDGLSPNRNIIPISLTFFLYPKKGLKYAHPQRVKPLNKMTKQNKAKTNQELGNTNILLDDAILFHNPTI